MSATTSVSISMDTELKAQAEVLFERLGLTLSTAFNVFVRQAIREGGMPFKISLNKPNLTTMLALEEAERIGKDKSVKGYNDLEELFEALEE